MTLELVHSPVFDLSRALAPVTVDPAWVAVPTAQTDVEILGIQLDTIARVIGLTLLSFLVATAVGASFRWYFRQRVNAGVSVLAGMASVAVYLNTRSALNQVIVDNTALFELDAVVFNTVAFLTAGFAAVAGSRLGDRAVLEFGTLTGATDLEGEVSRVVQTMGRRIAVTLPDAIEDIDGYEPVPQETKDELATRTFLFPRRITVEDLRDRLVTRLKDDYRVGYVDIDLTEDGAVAFLAVGQRVPGLGPTLGPEQAAVAVTADPPNAASPGDLVQVWTSPTDDGPGRRITTAEVRGVADDVVTLALDEHDARTIAGGEYRLLTLPAEPRTDREFAGLLRAADETMAAITVVADSTVVGRQVGDLDVTTVAIAAPTGSIEAIPSKSRAVEPNETLYVVARPDRVRRLETEATSAAPQPDTATPDTDGGQPPGGGEPIGGNGEATRGTDDV